MLFLTPKSGFQKTKQSLFNSPFALLKMSLFIFIIIQISVLHKRSKFHICRQDAGFYAETGSRLSNPL